jgi:hypothetical protein
MTGRMEKRCRDSHIPTAPATVFPDLKIQNERNPGYRPSSGPFSLILRLENAPVPTITYDDVGTGSFETRTSSSTKR